MESQEDESSAETRLLIQQPIQKEFRISDDAAKLVFNATAGQPRLVQRFGAALYDYQQVTDTPLTLLTAEDVKAVSSTVQQQSVADFQTRWDDSTHNERLRLSNLWDV